MNLKISTPLSLLGSLITAVTIGRASSRKIQALLRTLWILGGLCLLATTGRAGQVTFTVTGKPGIGDYTGYRIGQDYTFVFTTSAGYSSTGSSIFTGNTNYWWESVPGDPSLFATITSDTALHGSYVDTVDAPYSTIQLYNNSGIWWNGTDWVPYSYPIFSLSAGTSGRTWAGFKLLNGLSSTDGLQLDQIYAAGMTFVNPPPFSFPGSATDLATYMANYVGTYQINGGQVGIMNSGYAYEVFNIHTLTISVSAPETSATAALMGVGLVGLALFRRRVGSRPSKRQRLG